MARIVPDYRPFMYLRDRIYVCSGLSVMMDGTEEVVRTVLMPHERYFKTVHYWRCPVCQKDHSAGDTNGRDGLTVKTYTD